MKNYSNSTRKPMMYGGAAMKPKKKKMESGGRVSDADKKYAKEAAANADTQSRTATGRMSDKDKAMMEQQRIEELNRMTIETLRKIAGGRMSDKDTMLARKVLRDRGDKGAMPQSVDQ